MDANDAERFMGDPVHYREVYDATETHACVVTGCHLSQEEHHRLAYGLLNELNSLRTRVRDLENAKRP